MARESSIDVGVVGVGTMGQHHARVYGQLEGANLVGVYDLDAERAQQVARRYGGDATDLGTLLDSVDAVSIAVPTRFHYDVATSCLEAGVATLIEKPVVRRLENGKRLEALAREAGVPVQVGHIERFNPAVSVLESVVDDLDIIGVKAERLGPPPKRPIDDNAVLDLMIHDIDIVLSLLDDIPTQVQSAGVQGNTHATALLEFEGGPLASLTASRLTQRKVRRLEITAKNCLVELDYLDQTVEIHRRSVPEYIESNGGVQFTHESIIEQPHVPTAEPLKRQLEAFLESVRADAIPPVTIDDGLRALELATRIDRQDHQATTALEAIND